MLDPSGLLVRVPELADLLVADDTLAEAVAAGDPHRVYRRLGAAGRKGGGAVAEVARKLVGQRHRFYRAVSGRLVEWGFMGIGMRFSRSRPIPFAGDESTSIFGLHVWGALVWPTVEVVVGLDGAGRTFVIGELPPRLAPRAARAGVGAGLGVGLGFAAWFGLRNWAISHVFVVNGLDIAVSARLGEQTLALDAGAVAHVELAQGEYTFGVLRADGSVVESRKIKVDASQAATVVDIIGAAPILEVSAAGVATTHCATPLLARGDVGRAFGTPVGSSAASLQMGQGGWRSCVESLVQGGRDQEAAVLARGAAAQASDNFAGIEFASRLVRQALGHEADVEWLRPVADERPLDLQVQRLFLGALRRAKQGDEGQSRYGQLHAANPDSSVAAALSYDATSDKVAREQILAAALVQFPNDGELLRRHGMALLARGSWNAAGDALSAALLAQPELAAALRPAIASAWIAAGRPSDAAKLLLGDAGRLNDSPEEVRLYVANARRAPRRVPLSPEQAAAQYRSASEARTQDGEAREMAMWLSLGDDVLDARLLSVPDAGDRAYLQALARLGRDPVTALRRLESLEDDHLAMLDSTSWILFRGESISGGRTELQVRLDRNCPLEDEAAEAVRDYVAGNADVGVLEPLLPEQRAAGILARSRQAYARKDAAFLRVEAMQLDPLRGIVTVGAQSWPANR